MTTRLEKEKQKAQQEKFQAVLSNLLKDDDNKYCVDCDAKGPRWASWNLGIFLCIRCAGIHRNLGVHISKVKSVNLDTWTAEQISMMMEVGNSRARAAYEANLPDNYRRPQTDSALESFIRAKYEHKKYIAKEWVPPKPSVPRELMEDEKDKKKAKPKASSNLQLASLPRSQSGPAIGSQGMTGGKGDSKPTEKSSTLQQPKPTHVSSASAVDLIGLVFDATPTSDSNGSGGSDAPTTAPTTSNNLLGDLNDFMGSAPQPTPSSQQNNTQTAPNQMSNGSVEANLFGDTTSTSTSETKTSTKDSILALYGGQQQTQQQFGVPAVSYPSTYEGVGGVMSTNTGAYCDYSVPYQCTDPGGMYMPPQQQQQQQQQPQNMGVMYGMQQPQQMGMPQQGMYGNQMGMMGMQGNMGMASQQGMMGMGQQSMQMPQNSMGMYNQPQQQQQQQQPMQQMQFQQMQQQMAGMSLAGQTAGGQMGGMNQGWGAGQSSGHTLSTNLWQ